MSAVFKSQFCDEARETSAVNHEHHPQELHFMKLRRILQTMCCIASTTLLGCSTNPSVQQGASIQEFARSLSGQ